MRNLNVAVVRFCSISRDSHETVLLLTVVCLVAEPLNRSEARDDSVVIQNCCKLVLQLYHFKVTPNLTFIQRLGYNNIHATIK